MIPGKNPLENLIRGDFEIINVGEIVADWPVNVTISGRNGFVTFQVRRDLFDALSGALTPFLAADPETQP